LSNELFSAFVTSAAEDREPRLVRFAACDDGDASVVHLDFFCKCEPRNSISSGGSESAGSNPKMRAKNRYSPSSARLDVRGLPEAVLFAFECDVRDGKLSASECVDHRFGLIRRHHAVFETLEEHDRARQPFHVMDRRTLDVEIARLWIRADQTIEVARFELVCVARERLQIADSVVAGAGANVLPNVSAASVV
jgi:hypothetical protein